MNKCDVDFTSEDLDFAEVFVNSREEIKGNLVEIHSSLTDHRELATKLDTLLMEDNTADEDKNEDCDDTVLDVLSVGQSLVRNIAQDLEILVEILCIHF